MPTAGRPQKPSEPFPCFPLAPHSDGQWGKKTRGKIHFFGVWEDPDGALERYHRVAADLHAGRTPRPSTVSCDGVTVKHVRSHYLTDRLRKLEAGEISARWFENGRRVTDGFAKSVAVLVQRGSDIRPLGVSKLCCGEQAVL